MSASLVEMGNYHTNCNQKAGYGLHWQGVSGKILRLLARIGLIEWAMKFTL
jgi:hypothetical protein